MTKLLKELEFLAMDCQATGANPKNGSLLEIGWLLSKPSTNGNFSYSEIDSYVTKLPRGVKIPYRISRLTGIHNNDLKNAYPRKFVLNNLCSVAKKTAKNNKMDKCLTIIHFARYENPFLKDLYKKYGTGKDAIHEIVCTHEISKRLLPGLPRKSLRAIAGYLGHSVDEFRRCSYHVAATVYIWNWMINELENKEKIVTLEDLQKWLKQESKAASPRKIFPMNSEIRLSLPDRPGIYKMSRSNGDVLYIGKATSLKKRVNSYFQKRKKQAERTMEMLTQVNHFEITETGSALEAALLETDEIKKLSPPYNVALRENKRKLCYVSRDFRNVSFDQNEHFSVGPFPSMQYANAFVSLADILHNGVSNNTYRFHSKNILGVPGRGIPRLNIFKKGVELFGQRHEDSIKDHVASATIKKISSKLQRARILINEESDTKHKEPELENDSKKTIEESKWVWTAENVADAVESSIVLTGKFLRRIRWYSLLKDSTIKFSIEDQNNTTGVILTLKDGAVIKRRNINWENELHSSLRCKSGLSKSQKSFDIMNYDRLGVLTTELKKLISSGEKVYIAPCSKKVLDADTITAILRWL